MSKAKIKKVQDGAFVATSRMKIADVPNGVSPEYAIYATLFGHLKPHMQFIRMEDDKGEEYVAIRLNVITTESFKILKNEL